MNREETLEKAKQYVCKNREADYGSPEDNFSAIAALWAAYKGIGFSAEDVAMMMALLKIARIRTGSATEDSFVDLAGYAACGAEIAEKSAKAKGNGPNPDLIKECSTCGAETAEFQAPSYWYTFLFKDCKSAKEALDFIIRRFKDNSYVSVGDIYEFIGNLTTVAHYNHGWTNIDSLVFKKSEDGYVVSLGEPIFAPWEKVKEGLSRDAYLFSKFKEAQLVLVSMAEPKTAATV